MTKQHNNYDFVVIGSGPAGQNAAVTAANAGARVLVVEREIQVGGSCVQYGTIPSKTLRETAVTLTAFKRRSGRVYDIAEQPELRLDSLMTRLHEVVRAHQHTTEQFLKNAGVERIHGNSWFVSPQEVCVQGNRGQEDRIHADFFVIATGSRPRDPTNIPIDHENILDSDSILSMAYLPRSLAIFGGGVIACEYASTFSSLGVHVVMIDQHTRPLGFLDPDLVHGFEQQFESNGGVFLGDRKVDSVAWDGIGCVSTTLADGGVIETDKALVAQGRIANIGGLNWEAAGLTVANGLIQVNENYQTCVDSIYAVGDTIGRPALASSSMEQGRKAAKHAMGASHTTSSIAPIGIYTIPEIASVGLDEAQARKEYGEILVGKAEFCDLARGQIMASAHGLLKLIADSKGQEILGVQIVGDGATELVHLGQMAMLGSLSVDDLSAAIFNFPTLAEAYRLATLDICQQRTHPSAKAVCLA